MTSNDLRCPACSAHVSPGAGWCTLCYADLRPAPPVVEPAPVEEVAVEAMPVPQQAGEPGDAGRGKHARTATSYDDPSLRDDTAPADDTASHHAGLPAALEARADEMLAMLAAESSHPLGALGNRLESPRARVIAAAAGLAGLLFAGLLVMTLLGHFI